uniref:Proteophosphoglycan 5 n=1 Tax=Mycena chlorophos TaxID=658473 RepID=A0ABQ0LQM2_MYCCL|nr:predicted protein [Mycena chlorophos]
MDNSLRARYCIPAPKSPSRQRSPVKPARRRRCPCGFRHLFGGLKLFLSALLSLAVLFTQFPATDDPTTSLPSRTALSRVIPSVLRLPQMRAQAPPRKMPLVDRSVLQRLAALEIFPDPDERPYFSPDDTLTRMPLVTRIPETSASSKRSTPVPPLDCGPSPCRFLLPLRVAEQESNARLHLAQIIHLAHELDRTLVLPNVGKNHIGACFKWPFDAYYDPTQYINQTLRSGAPTVVSMEVFRHWLDNSGATNPTGRSVVLSSKLPENRLTITAFSTLQIRPGGDPEADFPSCFATKFDALNVFEHTPIHIFPTEEYPGPAIRELLSATNPFDEEEDESGGDATVVLLTYDYRHELFPSAIPPRYSPALRGLAARLAPSEPYVAVHWRTESGSVSSDMLVGCVENLVHVIWRLRDEHPELQVVWLASDISRDSGARILLERAFADEEKLVGLYVTELMEADLRRAHANAGLGLDPAFLRDTGLRSILEKLVASRARVFVTGGTGCARRSSFEQQIIDARRELEAENIVEYFTAELV